MTFDRHIRILIDAREFVHGGFTGIARVIQGLTGSLAVSGFCREELLAVHDLAALPSDLKHQGNVLVKEIPKAFLKSEKALSDLSRHFDLYISPYPKLPLFGVHCRAIHIIHDVLDLTHPLYRKRVKTLFDRYRLRKALQRADITWYDSSWSMAETRKHFGVCGRNPMVRYPGIQEVFQPEKQNEDRNILEAYGLKEGYVLALGNGMPHKNLGVLLDIAPQIERTVVFAGVSDSRQRYWESRHRGIRGKWITHVEEQHLPALLRGAFCLAQPSLVEGYGYPPLEAMACGRPVIVSSIPVLVETTGNCAVSASPNDPAAWRAALRTLENSSRYQDLVLKGLKWIEPLRGRRVWEPYLADIENLMKGS
jgi:glycosyltransferase involved in cell wall biosynthesis